MTKAEIETLLRKLEGRTLEFKRDLSSLPPILRTLVAFANTAGGTLVVGRDDDGVIRGVGNAKAEEERLSNAVAHGISPILLPDIEIVQIGDKDILLVRVARWPGPFFVRHEGDVEGVYVRLGSSDRRADEAMREELERASQRLAFDELPCVGAEVTDLDMEAVRTLFSAVEKEISDVELETLGIVTRYGESLIPSNGGVILFGSPGARRRYFDDARIRCARFAGSDKAEFLDRLDLEGSVLAALDEVPKFIRRNTRMAAKIEGLRRKDMPEYPSVSLREALVNAVVHTDYAQRGSQIMVSVFSDHLVIQNPGMLPFGMTIEDFKAGVSRIRNPVIARVFRELDLMEEWGSGYRRINDDCKAGGYPTPEWQELGSVVRVAFRPHSEIERDVPANVPINVPENLGLNKRQKWFLEHIAAGAKLKARDIEETHKVSEKTSKRDIEGLRRQKLIVFHGSPRTGTYRLRYAAIHGDDPVNDPVNDRIDTPDE